MAASETDLLGKVQAIKNAVAATRQSFYDKQRQMLSDSLDAVQEQLASLTTTFSLESSTTTPQTKAAPPASVPPSSLSPAQSLQLQELNYSEKDNPAFADAVAARTAVLAAAGAPATSQAAIDAIKAARAASAGALLSPGVQQLVDAGTVTPTPNWKPSYVGSNAFAVAPVHGLTSNSAWSVASGNHGPGWYGWANHADRGAFYINNDAEYAAAAAYPDNLK